MKLETPNSKNISSGVVQVAGATVGFLLPNGIANAVAKVDNEAVITDAQKKTKMYVNVACVLAGITLSMSVKGDDVMAQGTRSAALGLAGGGAKGLVTHFAKENVTAPAGTVQGRFISGALGCPCESQNQTYKALMMPRRSLRMPIAEIMQEKANSIAFDL